MSGLSEAERFLLDAVRRGDEQAWPQVVQRYQGRLLAFARQRVGNMADAEDRVQEAFIGLLRGIGDFRGDSSLETYLFAILRRRIIDAHRGQRSRVCLLHDTLGPGHDHADPAAHLPGPATTASWYAQRAEQHGTQRAALARAITALVADFKSTLNFTDLMAVELLFYAQLRNKDVAATVGVTREHVASLKHRSLAKIRRHLSQHAATDADPPDSLLTEVWEDHRPSCPKRSTIGAYHLGTLDPDWHGYVAFHLHRLGCRFCLANLEDLRAGEDRAHLERVRQRILQSTVGFLKPG